MIATIAFLCLASSWQETPASQSFGFTAEFDMARNSVRVTAELRVRRRTPDSGPPTTATGERNTGVQTWWVRPDSLSLRFVPMSGQRTEPKIRGLGRAWPKPLAASSPELARWEYSYTEFGTDWTGCKPGYYRMVFKGAAQEGNQRWTARYDTQVFYWRPMPAETPLLRVSQLFLSTGRHMREVLELNRTAPILESFGKTLTITGFGSAAHSIPVTFDDGRNAFELTFFSPHKHPLWLHPVFQDASAKDLAEKFVGTTVWPMQNSLDVLVDGSWNRMRCKRGSDPAVIRGIWRAARRAPVLGHLEMYLLGSKQELISGWYPLYVVFEMSPRALSSGAGDAMENLFVTLVADPWEFERQFSTTSMADDFRDWPSTGEAMPPIRLEVGMTPKQVAWIEGWPVVAASLLETLELPEWRYEPTDQPAYTYRFQHGKLQPGPGVIPKGMPPKPIP